MDPQPQRQDVRGRIEAAFAKAIRERQTVHHYRRGRGAGALAQQLRAACLAGVTLISLAAVGTGTMDRAAEAYHLIKAGAADGGAPTWLDYEDAQRARSVIEQMTHRRIAVRPKQSLLGILRGDAAPDPGRGVLGAHIDHHHGDGVCQIALLPPRDSDADDVFRRISADPDVQTALAARVTAEDVGRFVAYHELFHCAQPRLQDDSQREAEADVYAALQMVQRGRPDVVPVIAALREAGARAGDRVHDSVPALEAVMQLSRAHFRPDWTSEYRLQQSVHEICSRAGCRAGAPRRGGEQPDTALASLMRALSPPRAFAGAAQSPLQGPARAPQAYPLTLGQVHEWVVSAYLARADQATPGVTLHATPVATEVWQDR
jgi:hypothetical protein